MGISKSLSSGFCKMKRPWKHCQESPGKICDKMSPAVEWEAVILRKLFRPEEKKKDTLIGSDSMKKHEKV